MQQFGSVAQQDAFNKFMQLKNAERANWARVVSQTGEAYTLAMNTHLVQFKFPREEAWDAYSRAYLNGASLTKSSALRDAWRERQTAKSAQS